MEKISFHGNKVVFAIAGLLLLAFLSALGTYRLKKSAEIRHWQKELTSYNLRLENENQVAKGASAPEQQ